MKFGFYFREMVGIKKAVFMVFLVFIVSQLFSLDFKQIEEDFLTKIDSNEEFQIISLELLNAVESLVGENIQAIFPHDGENRIAVVTESSTIFLESDPLRIIGSEKNEREEYGETEVSISEAFSLSFLKTGMSPIAAMLVNNGSNCCWKIITFSEVITVDSMCPIILESVTVKNWLAKMKAEKQSEENNKKTDRDKPKNNKPDAPNDNGDENKKKNK
ncbi:MAG: hypothetical protein PWQ77_1957 [Kosmotogales bacterium]|nr:hypothetical protein [Kosmotogales bacterium]